MSLTEDISILEQSCDQSIAARFALVARRHAGRVAVQHGGQAITYRELDERSGRLAHALLEICGVGEEPVALLLDKGIPFFIAALAVWKAGKFIVPLDPTHPAARISLIREDVTARFLLTDSARFEMGKQIAGAGAVNLDALELGENPNPPAMDIYPDTPFAVIYTSGSTGRPKGVVQLQRNILWLASRYAENYAISADDRLAIICSLSVISAYTPFIAAWLQGATVCLKNLAEIDLADLADWLCGERITFMMCVPSLFRRLCPHIPDGGLPDMRMLALAGELSTRGDFELFKRHFDENTALANNYGSTECTPVRQYFFRRDEVIDGPHLPIGYPVEGIESRVIGPDGEDLPPGEVGQIVITTRYCATGYWNQPEATAAAFRTDPACPAVRTYLTGDMGFLGADGLLTCCGRRDFQVKIRGFRIETAEIELALRDIPAVKEAVVAAFAPEDDPAEKRLVAYFTAHHGQTPPPAPQMQRILRQTLPEYMIPAIFMQLEELPLNANNKLDRRALPDPLTASMPESPGYQAPAGELEVLLARIWELLLKVNPVGVNDDFFALGGNSLLAMEMLAKIEEATGADLPPGALLEAPTIAQLAPLIREGGWKPRWTSLRPLQTGGVKPPLFCVTAAGHTALAFRDLSRLLGPYQPFFALQEPDVDGKLNFESTIEQTAAHYISEMLTAQPEGPYYIAGASFGGLIAFEMAQQLRARGHSIAFLGVIDSIYRPNYQSTGSVKYCLREFVRLPMREKFAFLAARARRFIEVNGSLENLLVKPVRRMRQKMLLRRYKRDGRPAPITLRRGGDLQYYKNLCMSYVSTPYPGRLTLFRASIQNTSRQSSVSNHEYLGWQEVCVDIDLRHVEGNHRLFEHTTVIQLAGEMRKCLEQARGE